MNKSPRAQASVFTSETCYSCQRRLERVKIPTPDFLHSSPRSKKKRNGNLNTKNQFLMSQEMSKEQRNRKRKEQKMDVREGRKKEGREGGREGIQHYHLR